MSERPWRGRLHQAGHLVAQGATSGGRGAGRLFKSVLMNSTLDTKNGPRRFGDWLGDYVTVVPDHQAALVKKYPPREHWRPRPRFGGVYRSEDAAVEFVSDGTLRWNSGDDWHEGTWNAADGELEFRADGWLITGPIGEDRLFLSAFRSWGGGEELEAVFAEFVFRPQRNQAGHADAATTFNHQYGGDRDSFQSGGDETTKDESRDDSADLAGRVARSAGKAVTRLAQKVRTLNSDQPADEVPWNNWARDEIDEDGNDWRVIVQNRVKSTYRREGDDLQLVGREEATVKNTRRQPDRSYRTGWSEGLS